MLSADGAIAIHDKIIAVTGGATGVLSRNNLESALSRGYATFDGEELYKDIYLKIAAITYSLVKNHSFNDGNKRTACIALAYMLEENGVNVGSPKEEYFDLMMTIAEGRMSVEQIAEWIKAHERI